MSEKNYPTEWQKEIIWKALTILAFLVLVLLGMGTISLVLYGIVFFQTILIPLALASLLAFMLNPIVDRLSRLGISRSRAVIYVFLVFMVLFLGVLVFVIPRLYSEIVRIVDAFPAVLKWTIEKWQSFSLRYHRANWWMEGDQAMVWLQEKGPSFLREAMLLAWKGMDRLFSAFSLIIGMAVVPLYVYYLLVEEPHIRKHWRKYIPLRQSAFREEVTQIVVEVQRYLAAFFRGQLMVALTLGALATLGLSIAGLNYALLLGMLTGILCLIPYLGVMLSITPALIVAYFQSGCWWWDFEAGNWWYVLLVGCIYVLVQISEGWFITPRIQGRFVGLHPMTIIVSIFVWSLLLGGVLGALLAVPLTAVLKVLMFRYVWAEDVLQKNNQEKT